MRNIFLLVLSAIIGASTSLLIENTLFVSPATTPEQTKRLFRAIKNNGGKARLVMLPHEDHTYQARESIGHVLAEMVNWFDDHVKGDAEGCR